MLDKDKKGKYVIFYYALICIATTV